MNQNNALAGTTGTPNSTNMYVTNEDVRLADARTPTAHNQDWSTILNYVQPLVNWSKVVNITITNINLVSGIFSSITGIGVQTQNLNIGTYSLINATNVNSTSFYQNGTKVVDTITGKNISVSRTNGTYTLILPAANTSTLGGVTSLTCAGTDKLSAININGTPICAADQTGTASGTPFTAFNGTVANQTTTAAAWMKLVNLSLPLAAENNWVSCIFMEVSAAATNGVQLRFNTTNTESAAIAGRAWDGTAAHVFCSGTSNVSNACAYLVSGTTTLHDSTFSGFYRQVSNGVFSVEMASETAASLVGVMRGSYCTVISKA